MVLLLLLGGESRVARVGGDETVFVFPAGLLLLLDKELRISFFGLLERH